MGCSKTRMPSDWPSDQRLGRMYTDCQPVSIKSIAFARKEVQNLVKIVGGVKMKSKLEHTFMLHVT